ncbi:MAG TPA: protein phosphatase 2C domain-containing protein [Bacillota bacterium]|nr:protein phosphatase 2C domain-containing protein [Bacillota bacterium]
MNLIIIVIFVLAIIILSFRISKQKNSLPAEVAASLSWKSLKSFGKIIPGNAQHIGSREEQQDAFGFSDLQNTEAIEANGALAVLADGMGGLEKGSEASNLAVRTALAEYSVKPADEPISNALQRVMHIANQAVYEMARQRERVGSIGTTMLMAVIFQGQLYYASAGDSRIYLYRNGRLWQLTTDHVYAYELARMVNNSQISQEEAEGHPDRNALTSYLGLASLTAIDQNLNPLSLQPGDKVMLCSDGLYNVLSAEKMEKALQMDAPLAAETLIQKALTEGYHQQDNMTVAILQYASENRIKE